MRLQVLRAIGGKSLTWHQLQYHQTWRKVSTIAPLTAAFNTKRNEWFKFKFREPKSVVIKNVLAYI